MMMKGQTGGCLHPSLRIVGAGRRLCQHGAAPGLDPAAEQGGCALPSPPQPRRLRLRFGSRIDAGDVGAAGEHPCGRCRCRRLAALSVKHRWTSDRRKKPSQCLVFLARPCQLGSP